MAVAALAATLILGSWAGLAGPQPALAVDPDVPRASEPDPALALERLQAGRIMAMALVAARQTRRLHKAHAPARAYGAMRVMYHNEASLVLLPRRAPYTVGQLHAAFPKVVTAEGPGAWALREHIVVGPGATLVVTSPEVRELRLLSTSGRFVTIAGWKARIDLRGAAGSPLRITSWDPATGAADVNRTDGRAYIIAKAGTMNVADAQLVDLGFATGESSGVAWRGWPGIPSRGSAVRSHFERNYFGAYTFEAVDMRWTDNFFLANVRYGFDPHDHSDRFTVTGNAAIANGSHGMVFSRGCSNNTLRYNLSAFNGGNGFVLDDGRVATDGDPRHAKPDPSNDNLVESNVAWGNDAGIALEGASRNVVGGNLVAANRVGLRLKDVSSANTVAGNTIAASSIFGISVYASSAGNSVSDNRILGGKAGIVVNGATGNRVEHNAIAWITGRGIVLTGPLEDTTVSANSIGGRGTAAIDTQAARGLGRRAVTGNATAGWVGPRQFREIYTAGNFLRRHPAIGIWLTIILVPLAWWLPARRRRLLAWRRSAAASGAS